MVARNADHGAVREILRRMARELRDQEQARREMAQRIVEAQLIAPDADSQQSREVNDCPHDPPADSLE